MLSPDAASLAIAVAAGLVKLGERADVLFAEKEATTSALAIPMPAVKFPEFSRADKVEKLQGYLDATTGRSPTHWARTARRSPISSKKPKGGRGTRSTLRFERVFPGRPTHAGNRSGGRIPEGIARALSHARPRGRGYAGCMFLLHGGRRRAAARLSSAHRASGRGCAGGVRGGEHRAHRARREGACHRAVGP